MTSPEAFYLPLGDGRFEPTTATESPWDGSAQHGGPPTALLAHLAAQQSGQQPVRVSVDFLGAIPRAECTVEVSPLRPGRRIDLTEAVLSVQGRPAVVARVWSLAPGPTPPVVHPPVPPSPVEDAVPSQVLPHLTDWGYGQALEWRYARGSAYELGAADVWTRLRIPLVAGVEPTGTDRVLVAADAANGISAELPLEHWLSIPPGVTVHLTREAEGEWVHLACRTTIGANGLGLCTGTVSDAGGVVGEVAQPLLVRAR
ncbi:thioesterase family protein [Klenkia brasiliensis]|uniref:Thioesterase-like superfamily protein n=1 Tax=Klenkia brasiliensis TaxID=333142 RepID=A0A1G8A5M6_9ACTN|nr:thioesterase family protein [Klenkia brasiliensis]SDH16173.1 Thioesterase-like superfamily protein [Klenkia brasiliensis]